jgi:hypothetical protein
MLLTEDQLREWTGYHRRADLERVMRENGIRVLYGRDGRLCTTLSAVEVALGVRAASSGTSRRVPDFR